MCMYQQYDDVLEEIEQCGHYDSIQDLEDIEEYNYDMSWNDLMVGVE